MPFSIMFTDPPLAAVGATRTVTADSSEFMPTEPAASSLAPRCSDLEWTADALLRLPIYHPTLEGLKSALRELCEAVKSPDLEELDDVAPPGA
ncbi:hypothetical protein ABIF94_002500 [Bradyrhizobium ottawaense]|uniref:hypothetical protein n=1 Tax=Bradyrhizobium ottawaense TaxID=931866 RepID=UPI0038330020